MPVTWLLNSNESGLCSFTSSLNDWSIFVNSKSFWFMIYCKIFKLSQIAWSFSLPWIMFPIATYNDLKKSTFSALFKLWLFLVYSRSILVELSWLEVSFMISFNFFSLSFQISVSTSYSFFLSTTFYSSFFSKSSISSFILFYSSSFSFLMTSMVVLSSSAST